MFNRDIIIELDKWANKKDRKPLVLRGARQVGKTTVIEIFSKKFDQYIYLNLENKRERDLFENDYPFDDFLMAVFLHAGQFRNRGKTLIFIDEIQNSPWAIASLRYFYENSPDLFVIAAGSLLENTLNRNISFPVGRVEYMVLYPCSFREFLMAINDQESIRILESEAIPGYAHDHLTTLFKTYTTIGGMPQVISTYAESFDLTSLIPVYESLVISYREDIEKYASSSAQLQYIRHILANVFTDAGSRITFEKFGQSLYRSREMKEAFTAVEKTMLLKLIYPLTTIEFPVVPNVRKRPRLHLLDTGLVNFVSGLIAELLLSKEISDVYRGKIAEHIVGQELLSTGYSPLHALHFWVRDKNESTAEVDYILPWKGWLIPVEVKSGSIGKLRSLHQFIELSKGSLAVRVWQGKQTFEKVTTPLGHEFNLLSIPFYQVHRLVKELEMMKKL